ncbi:ATP-grasp domain-containing protein [Marixanthomonas ophiurae]|nr:D-alanine--D-alanine ligase [Marixanthomonas ophiurae]
MMESKKKVYNLIPKKYYAKTVLIHPKTTSEGIKVFLKKKGLTFPLIAKPDIGLRGSAVQKIHSEKELFDYHQKANFDYLIQDFIPYPNEIGVFYVRYPNKEKGKITGVVFKETLAIIGDGTSTIEELLNKTPRFQIQLKNLKKEHGAIFNKVLTKGEKLNLMPYGSHSRGAKFNDFSSIITPQLTESINKICLQIDGFYYGRLDIMYNTVDELEQGKNLMIVELNGAKSEPTHIYDPEHSLLFAWKTLAKHIKYMFEISQINHKSKGTPYLKYQIGIREMQAHFLQNKKIIQFKFI